MVAEAIERTESVGDEQAVEEGAEAGPAGLDASLAATHAEIDRARREIEEDRQRSIYEIGAAKARQAGLALVPPLEVSKNSSRSAPLGGSAARMSLVARMAPPINWEERASNLRLYEISEIVLRMQRFAILFINSTSDVLLTPDSRIDQIATEAARVEWYYDKVVAWEWFFGPYYRNCLPRVALEEVAPLLSLHPDWIRRRMRTEPPKEQDVPPERWVLSPALRTELYSRGQLRPPRQVIPEDVRLEYWFNRGDPELEALLRSRGGQREWYPGCGRSKPGTRKIESSTTALGLVETALTPVTRQILAHATLADEARPPSNDTVTGAFSMLASLGESALDALGEAVAVVR